MPTLRPTWLPSWLRALLPQGGTLPPEMWERRHRAILTILWLHVPVLPVLAIMSGQAVGHALFESGGVFALAILATVARRRRVFRSSLTTLGLVLSSAILVHISGGNIEMHFHFFVVVGLITLTRSGRRSCSPSSSSCCTTASSARSIRAPSTITATRCASRGSGR